MQSMCSVLNKRVSVPPLPPVIQEKSLQLYDEEIYQKESSPDERNYFGFVDNWSLMVWCTNEHSQAGHTANIMSWGYNGDFNNYMQLFMFDDDDGTLQLDIANAAGSVRNRATWAGVTPHPSNDWNQYVITWDGASEPGPLLYRNGSYVEHTTHNPKDGSGASTDTDTRVICIAGVHYSAAMWYGKFYSVGLYNTVLSPAEVSVIYNGGNARDIDLEQNFGAYTHSANLQNYWRCGLGSSTADFGLDRGNYGSYQQNISGGATLDASDLSDDIPDGS
jgi:hypothetical protein